MENLVVKGTGGFDYFANQLNYDLTATLTESSDGSSDTGFSVSPSLSGIQWPIHCEGSLDKTASDLCRPDQDAIESLLADVARKELKRKGQSELDKIIEEKAPKEVKELLKGLFRR